MDAYSAFLLGVVLTGLALVVFRWVRVRVRRNRVAATLDQREVTTISQILHLAVQGSNDGLTVVDHDGVVILTNARAHELGLVHERTLAPALHTLVQHTFADLETHSVDFEAQQRLGSRVTSVRAVAQPLTLVNTRYVVIYASDQSENIRMEAARRDFVANVSHELKTPVGAMALLAEAINESADDADMVEHFSAKIHQEAHRMGEMISDLISLSKLQGAEALPDMAPVAIDTVVEEAVNRNRLAAENMGIPLQWEPDHHQWLVQADASLLVTAVSNLIANAINYSSEGQPVEVSVHVPEERHMLEIIVADHGMGIEPKHQQRVFERFFRVDKARSRRTGGTGLGLAIVKHVAVNHGGNIRLWSRPQQGSTFTLELPLMDQ